MACPDQTEGGNAHERASQERRCKYYPHRREPQNAGRDAHSLDAAGEGKAPGDADLSSNPGPESDRRGRGQADHKPNQRLEGARLSRLAHDRHQERRGDDIAKTEQTIGHHKNGKARIGLMRA